MSNDYRSNDSRNTEEPNGGEDIYEVITHRVLYVIVRMAVFEACPSVHEKFAECVEYLHLGKSTRAR